MSEEKKQNSPAPRENTVVGAALIEYVELFVFAAVTVILLMIFVIRPCVVNGPSMNNTLQNGEHLLVSGLFYKPQAGDIIVFHQTSETTPLFNEPIVKRVIATGGQYVKLDFDACRVYVSDDAVFDESEALDESSYAYFSGGIFYRNGTAEVYHVPEGHLFVMGDNRNNSSDSRVTEVSFVDERRVLGKVLIRITPFSKFGKID